MPTTPRMGSGPNQDMTGRNYSYDFRAPVYAATIALASPTKTETLVQIGQLTGALALSALVTTAYLGDKLIIMVTADGSNRTITFGAGFLVTAATLVVPLTKGAQVEFIFNGTAFVENSRAIYI